jgi:hypothetical protein
MKIASETVGTLSNRIKLLLLQRRGEEKMIETNGEDVYPQIQ